ncbi:WD40 repeat domain-containing protein [Chloropicon primus]|nr:WD40 repeat domain-containing protein [Chloropicon primus]
MIANSGSRPVSPQRMRRPSSAIADTEAERLDYEAFEGLSSVETLELVKRLFDQGQVRSDAALTEDQFVVELGKILLKLNLKIEESFLRRFFSRVDVNADGKIDWNEFSSFLLVENQAARLARDSSRVKYTEKKNLAKEIKGGNIKISLPGDHTDMISRILVLKGGNRYISCGRDGIVKTWKSKSKNVQDEYSFDAIRHEYTFPSQGSSWITDATLLPEYRKLMPFATCTVARQLKIFDLNMKYCLGNLITNNVPHALCNINQELLSYGDSKGYVHLLSLRPYMSLGVENRISTHYSMHPRVKYHLHSDWVTKILFLPEMNALGSASLDGTMRLIDFEKGEKNRTMSRTYTPDGTKRALYAFDWIPSQKLLISGGMGCNLVLWNIFTKRAIAELKGHKAAISDILVIEPENQIISLSIDKTVAIWDLRMQRSIQIFKDGESYRPEDTVNAIAYDEWAKCIITGAIRPKQWVLNEAGLMRLQEEEREYESSFHHTFCHTAPVVSAVYTSHTAGIISCDKYGLACLWDSNTGKPQFQFNTITQEKSKKGSLKGDSQTSIIDDDATIVAMCLDSPNNRKLITSASDGRVQIWNYNSGLCLKNLENPSKNEISSIAHYSLGEKSLARTQENLSKFILGSGTKRSITVWEDAANDDVILRMTKPFGSLPVNHKDDVLCMSVLSEIEPPLLASGDGNGTVWIWNLESGKGKAKFECRMEDFEYYEKAIECVEFVPKNVGSRGSKDYLIHQSMTDYGPLLYHRVAASGTGNTIFVYDFIMGEFVSRWKNCEEKGESVLSMAHFIRKPVEPEGKGNAKRRLSISATSEIPCYLASGNVGGELRVWSLDFKNGSRPDLVTFWKGHAGAVNSIQVLERQIRGQMETFLVTASSDCHIGLWTWQGTHVGMFGIDIWSLEDPKTWQTVIEEDEEEAVEGEEQEGERMEEGEKARAEEHAPATKTESARTSRSHSLSSDADLMTLSGAKESSSESIDLGASSRFQKRKPAIINIEMSTPSDIVIRKKKEQAAAKAENEEKQKYVEFSVDGHTQENYEPKPEADAKQGKALSRPWSAKDADPIKPKMVYFPRPNSPLNFVGIKGRHPASVAHLMYIEDLRCLDKRPTRSELPQAAGTHLRVSNRPKSAPAGKSSSMMDRLASKFSSATANMKSGLIARQQGGRPIDGRPATALGLRRQHSSDSRYSSRYGSRRGSPSPTSSRYGSPTSRYGSPTSRYGSPTSTMMMRPGTAQGDGDSRFNDVDILYHVNPDSENYLYDAWLSNRVPVTARIENLQPWQEYNIEVRAILKTPSTEEINPPAAGSVSAGKAVLAVVPRPTATGSGGMQVMRSGVEDVYISMELDSCEDETIDCSVYINEDLTIFQLFKNPISMKYIAADFTGDGCANDLVWINWNNHNQLTLGVLGETVGVEGVQSGSEGLKGTFVSGGDLSSSIANSTNGVAFDANGDGRVDLYVTNDGSPNGLLINQGPDTDGEYPYSHELFTSVDGGDATSSSSRSKAAIKLDCNRDGAQDLFVVNYNEPNKLYLNDGTGTFEEQESGNSAPISATSNPSIDAVAYVCGQDGKLCIFVVNQNGVSNEFYVENGNCNFVQAEAGEATAAKVGSENSTSVAAGDLDGDGDIDLFVTNLGQRNQIFLNRGNEPTFGDHAFTADHPGGVHNDAVKFSHSSYHAIALDLDGDGDLDLYVANGRMASQFSVSFDYNSDGALDIIVFNHLQENQVLVNDGSGIFALQEDANIFTDGTGDKVTKHAVTFDANNDGHDDLFIVNYESPNELLLSTCVTDTQCEWEKIELGSSDGKSMQAVAFDATGNGHMDLYVVNNGQRNDFWVNDGEGGYAIATGGHLSQWMDLKSSVAVVAADFNGDGSTE